MRWSLICVLLLTGCTIRLVDDTSDYDITGSLKSSDCEVEINRVESKSTGRKEATKAN